MKISELCFLLKLSENTIKDQFNRTNEYLLEKYGFKIIKTGRGINTEYEIFELYEDAFKEYLLCRRKYARRRPKSKKYENAESEKSN